MAEQWKTIEGYENYEVSTLGNVRNLKTGRILSPGDNRRGYYFINLRKDGKTMPRTIHRLVADAFIPNPANKTCVDHQDRNRMNNVVSNLRWVTHSENGMNASVKKSNTSGLPGIYWNKNASKWHVRIKVNGVNKHVGFFSDFEDAVTARQYAQQEHHGQYANIINIQNVVINN